MWVGLSDKDIDEGYRRDQRPLAQGIQAKMRETGHADTGPRKAGGHPTRRGRRTPTRIGGCMTHDPVDGLLAAIGRANDSPGVAPRSAEGGA